MALVNVKSPIVANYDAQPRIPSPSYIAGANNTTGTAIVPVGATDITGSTYRLAIISSGVVLAALNVMNDALNNGTTFNFGVTNTTQVASGSLPVLYSDQIFATGIVMTNARTVMTPILSPTILNGSPLAANASLRIWELLGFAADPFVDYCLVATSTLSGYTAGNIAVQFTWLR